MDPFLGSIGLLRLKIMNKPLQMISKGRTSVMMTLTLSDT
ncbi:hypothetical protein CCACVL1_20287 [Corchorus capsularis]|uniref:Uncharacterized protein n=1 Tax=Corchorus capsularis TaxID=210143 RepID=A0A1R3HBU8_COCAP|nr:hypothetical protein CCACVL1_20287 [Corchorus capsularis]